MKKILLALTLILVGFACTYEQSETTTIFLERIDGQVQKGPFADRTTITVSELSESLTPTGTNYRSTIPDDTGKFTIENIELEESLVRVAAEGFYFDESKGALSDSRLSLFAFADVNEVTTINVNLMGHLETPRIKYLVRNKGKSFADAKYQAHQEVLDIFQFYSETVENAENLDITKRGEGNAKLLAMSVILQGARTVPQR